MSGFQMPEITTEMIAQLPEEERGPWIEFLEQRERGLAHRRDLEERREYSEALTFYDSKERAEALVRWAPDLSDDEVRSLLTEWWSTTEAWSGDERLREGMLGLLRRVAPLVVVEGSEQAPRGQLEIFRGNSGDDPLRGHSWTRDKRTAQRFARMTMSPRGMFLGMNREGGAPTVWRAFVDAQEILGYFNDRSEREVVVDPATLMSIEKIQEAR